MAAAALSIRMSIAQDIILFLPSSQTAFIYLKSLSRKIYFLRSTPSLPATNAKRLRKGAKR
ncbi:hypothetical protein, partial [Bradyrhizobium lablabi]|uniref:hypothetical protein n=1 Tax=Bradyrhizobium lablabi TaxID=722472 RepID=UPI001AEC897B